MAVASSPELAEGGAQPGIVGSRIDGETSGRVFPDVSQVQPAGLPGRQALAGEFRKAVGIARDFKGLPGQQPAGLVVAMPVGGRSTEDRQDDLRAKGTDGADQVLQDAVAPPLAQRLLGALGEPEVEGPAEVLPGAVELVGRHHLPGPDQAQGIEQVRTHQVLTSLAPGQAQDGGPGLQAPADVGHQPGRFVVGMGSDEQDPRDQGQTLQGLGQPHRPAIQVELVALAVARRREGRPGEKPQKQPEPFGTGAGGKGRILRHDRAPWRVNGPRAGAVRRGSARTGERLPRSSGSGEPRRRRRCRS